MKKILFLASAIMLCCIFQSCKKDGEDDNNNNNNNTTPYITASELQGKWSASTYGTGTSETPADLDDQLSYTDFKAGGILEDYSYYDYEVETGTYTLSKNDLTIIFAGETNKLSITGYKNGVLSCKASNGVITNLKRSTNQALFYLEPSVNFGASQESVKSFEKRKLKTTQATSLQYEKSNTNETGVAYLFENNKMTSATVLVSLSSDPEALATFLKSRYTYLGSTSGTSLFDGGAYQVAVSSTALLGPFVMYLPTPSRANSFDESENFRTNQTLELEKLIK